MTMLIFLLTAVLAVDNIMSVVIFETTMRITLEKKQETRQRLLKVAGDLFRDKGFGPTTTRHIAKKAHLASGTMFNYFRSKEELALALVAEYLEQAHAEFEATRRPAGSLEEWLFALIATELRHLNPTRAYLTDILDGVLHPFAAEESSAAAVRRTHLERVHEVLDHFGIEAHVGSTGWEHLYWSLYLGILAHWSADVTPNQEATMALLDRAIAMFLSLVRFSPAGL
jgi:AcrR family transcriptional regulator